MDINRFEEFIVLADCLNYSKAASLLYVTQPVLSRHIHELEDALGAQLFIRNTHKVTLTPVGELAAAELSKAMESYHMAMRNIKLATENLNGRISVGFLGQAVRPFITRFIQHLGSRSDLQMDYVSATELDTLIHLVEANVLDLAFITHIETGRISGMEVRKIDEDPLYVVVPRNHPLAERESLSIRDLSGEPVIAFNRDTNPHTAIFHEKLFQRFDAEMNVVRKVSNLESGLFYADLGLGFFILPQHLLELARDMTVLPINDEGAVVSLRLIWKKNNEKLAVQTFVQEFTAFHRSGR